MEWDNREMRATSVGKRRKGCLKSEAIRWMLNVDGEQEEEEDAGQEKKRVKLTAGPVGKGKERAICSEEEEDERLHRSSVMGQGKSKRK